MIKNFNVAIQLYSLRDDMASDFEGTINKVREMGYDGVEFAGLFGKSAKEVKEICERAGVIPVSAHVPYADMIANPDILEVYKEIGCEYVAIPWITVDHFTDSDKVAVFLDNVKMLGKKAKELGMKFCYHNHDFEFVKTGEEYALDMLYREVPKELLETELDTCWVNVGGENPSEYIRKYKDRTSIVHLKDFVGSKTENMYALIGKDENEEKNAGTQFEFRPVGYGVQDFVEILKAASEVGAKWVVVEQDSPSLGKTPSECAKMSIDFLKTL